MDNTEQLTEIIRPLTVIKVILCISLPAIWAALLVKITGAYTVVYR